MPTTNQLERELKLAKRELRKLRSAKAHRDMLARQRILELARLRPDKADAPNVAQVVFCAPGSAVKGGEKANPRRSLHVARKLRARVVEVRVTETTGSFATSQQVIESL